MLLSVMFQSFINIIIFVGIKHKSHCMLSKALFYYYFYFYFQLLMLALNLTLCHMEVLVMPEPPGQLYLFLIFNHFLVFRFSIYSPDCFGTYSKILLPQSTKPRVCSFESLVQLTVFCFSCFIFLRQGFSILHFRFSKNWLYNPGWSPIPDLPTFAFQVLRYQVSCYFFLYKWWNSGPSICYIYHN